MQIFVIYVLCYVYRIRPLEWKSASVGVSNTVFYSLFNTQRIFKRHRHACIIYILQAHHTHAYTYTQKSKEKPQMLRLSAHMNERRSQETLTSVLTTA